MHFDAVKSGVKGTFGGKRVLGDGLLNIGASVISESVGSGCMPLLPVLGIGLGGSWIRTVLLGRDTYLEDPMRRRLSEWGGVAIVLTSRYGV